MSSAEFERNILTHAFLESAGRMMEHCSDAAALVHLPVRISWRTSRSTGKTPRGRQT